MTQHRSASELAEISFNEMVVRATVYFELAVRSQGTPQACWCPGMQFRGIHAVSDHYRCPLGKEPTCIGTARKTQPRPSTTPTCILPTCYHIVPALLAMLMRLACTANGSGALFCCTGGYTHMLVQAGVALAMLNSCSPTILNSRKFTAPV